MKKLLSITGLATALCCQAQPSEPPSAPASPASAALPLPKDRCPPPPPLPKVALPTGEYRFNLRILVKADGSVDDVRVEGRGARNFKRAINQAFDGYRCLPATADQEYVIELKTRTRPAL